MKTRTWKSRFVFLLGVLVILLPFGQSLATGITAIAVTLEKEGTAQELFDNEYGNGKITYTREGDSINWELDVTKTAQDNPTRFVATLKNADGIVMPQLSKNDQFKVSDDSSSQDYGKILQKDASAKEQKETIKFTTASLDKATLTVAFLDEDGTKALYEKDITIEIPASEEATTEPEASAESSTEATAASSDSSAMTETTDSAIQTTESTDAASVDSSSTESSDVTDLGDADEATVDSAKKEAEKKYEETGRPQVITRSAAEVGSNPIDGNGLMIGQNSFSKQMRVYTSETNENNIKVKLLKFGVDAKKTLPNPGMYLTTIRDMFVDNADAETVYIGDVNSLHNKDGFSIRVFYDNVGYYNIGDEKTPDLRTVGAVLTVSNLKFKNSGSAAIQFSDNMYSGVSYNNIQSMNLSFKFYDTSYNPYGTPEEIQKQQDAIKSAIKAFDESQGTQDLELPIINFSKSSNSYLSFASLNPSTNAAGTVLKSYEFAGARYLNGAVKKAATITENGNQIEVKGDLVALNGGQTGPVELLADASKDTYFGDIAHHGSELNGWNGANADNKNGGQGDKLGLPNFWRTGVSFNLEGAENYFVLGSTGGEAWNTFSSNAFVQIAQTPPYKTVEPLTAFDNATQTWSDKAPNYNNRRDNDLDRRWDLPEYLRAINHDPMVGQVYDPINAPNGFFANGLMRPESRYVPKVNDKYSYYYFVSQPMINIVSQSVILPDSIIVSDILPPEVTFANDTDSLVVYDLHGNPLKSNQYKVDIGNATAEGTKLEISFPSNTTKLLNIQSGAIYSKNEFDSNPQYGGDVSIRIKVTAKDTPENVERDISNKAKSSFIYANQAKREQASNETIVRIPQKASITAKKVWEDKDNQFKLRPTIHLNLERKLSTEKDYKPLQEPKYSFEIVADTSDDNPVEHTFTDLDKVNENGVTYDYRVVEKYVQNETESETSDYYDSSLNVSGDNPTFIFTNTLKTIPIKIIKKDTQNKTLPGAVFEIRHEDNIVSRGTSGEDGVVNFDQDLPVGDYTITETSSPTGLPMNGSFSVMKDGNDLKIKEVKGSDNSLAYDNDEDALVAINRYVDLTIIKKDSETNKLLPGAEFTLTQLQPNASSQTIISDSEGNLKFDNLKAGEYELKEIKAPDGYQKLAGSIKFTISADGKISSNDIDSKITIENENTGTNVSNIQISFDITNKPKVPLPSTGGSGTWMYYLAGSLALVVVGGYLFYRSRNSKGVA